MIFDNDILSQIADQYVVLWRTDPSASILPLLQTSKAFHGATIPHLYRIVQIKISAQWSSFHLNATTHALRCVRRLTIGAHFDDAFTPTVEGPGRPHETPPDVAWKCRARDIRVNDATDHTSTNLIRLDTHGKHEWPDDPDIVAIWRPARWFRSFKDAGEYGSIYKVPFNDPEPSFRAAAEVGVMIIVNDLSREYVCLRQHIERTQRMPAWLEIDRFLGPITKALKRDYWQQATTIMTWTTRQAPKALYGNSFAQFRLYVMGMAKMPGQKEHWADFDEKDEGEKAGELDGADDANDLSEGLAAVNSTTRDEELRQSDERAANLDPGELFRNCVLSHLIEISDHCKTCADPGCAHRRFGRD